MLYKWLLKGCLRVYILVLYIYTFVLYIYAFVLYIYAKWACIKRQ